MPLYIRQLPALHPTAASFIPPATEMVSFSADFLRNTFGGTMWSPGLNFIVPTVERGPCILANRSYYTLDMRFEPYLPKQPGQHGAKLTPFFNENPEEKYDIESGTSFENVPMFVMTPDTVGRQRYVYFGNYSQTRWSDKLDYDRMVEHVPHSVKDYWAEELSAVGRPGWVTDQLKKHFFPKPQYEGQLFARQSEGSVAPDEEAKLEQKVEQDVKAYIMELKAWDADAAIRVNMIKKNFIMDAFERADIDEPQGLRLWWEYLQCVHWNRDLYDFLVGLQSRNSTYA
ncbi:hypothetical protein K505DRAFT_389867 [Melanomma pulvis-pyrius CBS 109.77]|uniref:DUF6697 domain-containing protein n=1 Tax=Melanomma pulvis-pyrius CBS 109.77 TaxID=1314802 RepID=A0A6A6X4E5_9PLEO|nr:hypothetical protein K505DRAFT_389867 [Melanomma pulvis-pyrius CBS 109.77]